jgi:hypothetical protein
MSFMMTRPYAAFLISLAAAFPASPAVTSVEVSSKTPVLAAKPFGSAGSYERLQGTVRFAVDPNLPANHGMADLKLAPRNAEGQVEFSANFYVLQPVDASRSNGTALVEVSNRGGKALLNTFDFAHGTLDPQSEQDFGDGFLLRRGFTLVWIGWEFDVPARSGLLRLLAPIATDNGKTITGLVRSEWMGDEKVTTISLGDRAQTAYAVADENDPANKMYVRDQVDGPRTVVPRLAWQFADATHVTMAARFEPGRIYEIVYRAKDPVVAGLGFAAVRDLVASLKYDNGASGLGDERQRVRNALGFGISQDGRFLRTFLYEGFNTDEHGRRVFDGVWAHVGGVGRGSFNERFAQPSRDGHPFMNVFYPVDIPPFSTESLLTKERQAGTVPKLFLTNGSYEYWGRCASLIHTSEDGVRDVPLLAGTRIYFLAGSQHSAGTLPPQTPPAQNEASVIDYRPALRALLVAMQSWLVNNAEPPPSQIPTISSGQLVTRSNLKFPSIPGVDVPHHLREAYRLDFSVEPPNPGPPFPVLVPQVDSDGNETSGIRMPELSAPLATYTGWNLRKPSIGAPDEMLSMIGSYIPFARTKTDREKSSDPRPSIAERYASRDAYLERISAAARKLVENGYVLKADLPRIQARASEEWALASEATGVIRSGSR